MIIQHSGRLFGYSRNDYMDDSLDIEQKAFEGYG